MCCLGGSDETKNFSLLHTLRVDGSLKVTYDNGTLLSADEKVAACNNFPHTLFQSINISINDQPVSDTSRLYPHKSYFASLLSFSKESKDYNLISEFYLDETLKSKL